GGGFGGNQTALPGDYLVTVRVGDQVARTTVRVERVSGDGNDAGLQSYEDRHGGASRPDDGGSSNPMAMLRQETPFSGTLADAVRNLNRERGAARQAVQPRLF
ncbi:MAG: hypothetical protein ABUL71_02605, partial [Gemmatimonadota bacterium]